MSVSILVLPDLLYTGLFLGGARVNGLISLGVTTFDGRAKMLAGESVPVASAGTGNGVLVMGASGGSGTTDGSTIELLAGKPVPVTSAGIASEEPDSCSTVLARKHLERICSGCVEIFR